MTRSIILTLLILSSTLIIQAQKGLDNFKIYNCKSDSVLKISLIPENILTSDYDLIVLDFKADTIRYNTEKGFEIHWPAPFLDGRLTLVINRKQIYLRSGHDNPNANHLYWIENINNEIYNKISKAFSNSAFSQLIDPYYKSQYLGYSFNDYMSELEIPNEWNDSLIEAHRKDHEIKSYKNLERIINIINAQLDYSQKILIPRYEDFTNIKRRRIVVGLFELEDQIQMIKIE